MTKNEIESKSRGVCTAFAVMKEFLNSHTVCVYMSAFNEVDTQHIIDECKRLGKNIVAPVVEGEDIYLCRLEGELEKGAFGINQPVVKETVPVSNVDIFAVPGLAFDGEGARVGFGKGYYDKLLADSSAVKVGLCYDFQLVREIQGDRHDISMDYVITESGNINCRKDK